jgi:hypothetical protein
MRDWKLLAVAFWAAAAVTARAQSAAPQVVVVPDTPPVAAPPPMATRTDGGTAQIAVVPVGPDVPAGAGDGGSPVATGPGEPDAGAPEEVQLLLIPAKPPPAPEPPRQIKVTVMHQPRPRVEYGQAATELGVSTGVFTLSAAILFAAELIPITLLQLFNNRPAADMVLRVGSVANAFILPLAGTIAIEKVKAHSVHYQLEGLGWWATYGVGLFWQGISTIYTLAALNVNTYIASPPLVVFGALTPVSQTIVANALAEPRDPLAPLEGMSSRAPVLLDGNGRPIPTFNLVRFSW